MLDALKFYSFFGLAVLALMVSCAGALVFFAALQQDWLLVAPCLLVFFFGGRLCDRSVDWALAVYLPAR